MEWVQQVILGIIGLASGLGVSGGVFTTLIAVGLIPRFAGKTHTAKHIFLYEEMVKNNCDYIATIPMIGKINSLNASVSCAIVLSHITSSRSS